MVMVQGGGLQGGNENNNEKAHTLAKAPLLCL